MCYAASEGIACVRVDEGYVLWRGHACFIAYEVAIRAVLSAVFYEWEGGGPKVDVTVHYAAPLHPWASSGPPKGIDRARSPNR